MRTSFLPLFFLPVLTAQTPSVAEILTKVGDLYGNAQQYRFVLQQTGEEPAAIQIAVQKPYRFHFETDGEVIGGNERFGAVTMVSDGNAVWNYSAGLKQYTRKNTSLPLVDVEPAEVSPEVFVFEAETLFITHFARFARAPERAKLLREEPLQTAGKSIDCYVIEFDAPVSGFRDKYTWWVDKARGVVMREDTQPSNSRFRPSRALYSVAEIDQPLPEELFHFTPPPEARLVDRLE